MLCPSYDGAGTCGVLALCFTGGNFVDDDAMGLDYGLMLREKAR
jgi:hypothetical protein